MTKASVPPPTYAPLSESIIPTTELRDDGFAIDTGFVQGAPPWTNGEPGPIPHVEPVIPMVQTRPSVIPDYSEMRMTLQNILTMDVCTEPGQEEPHSVMRRVAAQGLGVEEPEPVMSDLSPLTTLTVHEHHHASFDVPGYEHLADILTAAYDQSARGKGKERHANAAPWHEQRINTIPAQQKSIADGLAYQVQKKTLEACDMAERGDLDAAEREMLGAIVYAAACIEQIRRAKLIKA